MNKKEILKQLRSKIFSKQWHHLRSCFHPAGNLKKWEYIEYPLPTSIAEACFECEKRMKGYADNFIDKLASYSDREDCIEHYDQILQHLAELLVVSHLAKTMDKDWIFKEEPTAGKSKKNPEISIAKDNLTILVEVKSPRFFEYQTMRCSSGIQVPSRIDSELLNAAREISNSNEVALPRDNIVKDFLISANNKFKSFKEENSNVLSVLVVVWDDFVFEPISSLANSSSGLITDKSFYKDANGKPIKFKYIDNIVVLRHMTQIANSTKNIMVSDGLSHPLDYGKRGQTLPKALIAVNQHPKQEILLNMFECEKLENLQNVSDYRPQEFIIWLG